jgi:hypothetical protein
MAQQLLKKDKPVMLVILLKMLNVLCLCFFTFIFLYSTS